jgi:hypothetical protein
VSVTTTERQTPREEGMRTTGSRAGVIFLIIVSLIATSFTRDWAIGEHNTIRNNGRMPVAASQGNSGDSALNSMPSFATALLLGGLRGPLVMILWTSSENQKQEHNLQDFDTKVEWIRLLQPEFDTVHLFQIWNKAYNISVQMASLANKYTTILDAIDYGQKVERERPDDINIITAVAALFGDKLGTSQEHVYYRSRVRRESQTLVHLEFPVSETKKFQELATKAGWTDRDAPPQTSEKTQTVQVLLEPMIARQIEQTFTGSGIVYSAETRKESQQNDPTWRRVRLDPVVDESGNVLPQLLVPRYPRPQSLAADAPWYDGSQMQFLKQYEPFPYGVSTLALAYNEYKKSQLLQTLWGQHHIQTGDTVVDARPALTLKDWAKDEWERGRRFELALADIEIPESADPSVLELPTAGMPLDFKIPSKADYDAALYSYGTSARLFRDGLAEFQRHIAGYQAYASVYFVHMDDCMSGQHLMQADHDYLAAMTATGDERTKLLQSAANEYKAAVFHEALTVLKYYVDDQIVGLVYPKDPKTVAQYNRATIEAADPATYLNTLSAVEVANARLYTDPTTHQYSQMRDTFHDDREPYMFDIKRCGIRLALIHAAGIDPK